jgi:hypothetical protein
MSRVVHISRVVAARYLRARDVESLQEVYGITHRDPHYRIEISPDEKL